MAFKIGDRVRVTQYDNDGRLVLHEAIGTVERADTRFSFPYHVKLNGPLHDLPLAVCAESELSEEPDYKAMYEREKRRADLLSKRVSVVTDSYEQEKERSFNLENALDEAESRCKRQEQRADSLNTALGRTSAMYEKEMSRLERLSERNEQLTDELGGLKHALGMLAGLQTQS